MMVKECEYCEFNDGDGVHGPCKGPVAPHDCSYESELAKPGEKVKQCHCCDSCARECYMNI